MVSKETKETILATIDEVFQKMNSISWINRQKAMSKEAFKNTEKILYCFNVLKEHVSNEQEYLEIALHRKSKSITSYIKNGGGPVDDDTKLRDRMDSYHRSLNDVKRVEAALEHIKEMKGYEIIEIRYFNHKAGGEKYTWEEIASMLAGSNGYSDNLNEKTVRAYKSKIIKEMAVYLFGSDAI